MKKWKADLIHDGYQFIKNHVLITADDGTVLDMLPEKEAGSDDLVLLEGILCPGFVNTHCHLELSHLKGKVAEHTGLVSFLLSVVKGRNNFSKEEIEEAAVLAEKEMIQSGIVAVGDISNGTDSLPVKKTGRLHYHTFVECLGITDKKAEDSLQRSLRVLKAFEAEGLPAGIVPHAPYSVSKSLFALIDQSNISVQSIHNQETAAEDDFYKGRQSGFYRMLDELGLDYSDFHPTGKSSLRSYLPYFTHHQPILLVHNTYTSEEDIRMAENCNGRVYWCLCPNANMYIENKMPPVQTLRKLKTTITLGTDSLASNHRLSVFSEMQTLQKHFPDLPLEEMLCWATSNGAAALQCENRFGSFHKGEAPGLIQIKHVVEDRLTPRSVVKRLL